uniref:hypothetical protein n=1 Tax=uncultured Bacteroides sp. TaxID=162156 RepID=UPI00280B3185
MEDLPFWTFPLISGPKGRFFYDITHVFCAQKTSFYTKTAFFQLKYLQVRKVCVPLHPQTRNNGAIAQMVEQRTENPCVPG